MITVGGARPIGRRGTGGKRKNRHSPGRGGTLRSFAHSQFSILNFYLIYLIYLFENKFIIINLFIASISRRMGV